MAKKSAASKGYRRQTAKKPYLSKKDIITLCVILAVVAVGAWLLFSYNDGALKVRDGKVAVDGDNWLIVNGSNSRGGKRYYKLGEVGELEGYSREAGTSLTDDNIPDYTYTAEAEDAAIQTVGIVAGHRSAEALAENAAARMPSLGNVEVSEVKQTQVGEQTVYYFVYTTSPDESQSAEAAEPAETAEDTGVTEEAEPAGETGAESTVDAESTEEAEPAEEAEVEAPYHRDLCGYIDASHESSVVFRVNSGADALEDCADEDALVAVLQQAVGIVTLEGAGKP